MPVEKKVMIETTLKAGATRPPEIRAAIPPATGQGVLDESTFDAIEVGRLFDVINSARTRIGQASLFRALARPPFTFAEIRHRQEALLEIDTDPELKSGIEALVNDAQKREQGFYDLLYNNFLGLFGDPKHDLESSGFGYQSYQTGTYFCRKLVDGAASIKKPESIYLKQLFGGLKDFGQSRVFALMRGPVYCSADSVITREEKKWYSPALRFRPTLFKPFFWVFTVVILMMLDYSGSLFLNLPTMSDGPFFSIGTTIITPIVIVAYVAMIGTYDRDYCIFPLRNIYRDSADVHKALDILGKLDELLALSRYAESFVSFMTMPEIVDAKHHQLALKQVVNPILAKQDPHYVANSIDLETSRLCFVTGPNSGGKTALCKTLAQVQLLAQIGSYIPASQAKLSVVDHIHYQIPSFSSLKDHEGRFGSELRRTKAIFLATTPKSLIILDELSEGTTYEEKLVTSRNILDGFYRKGNNTMLITHNHELVDQFIDKGIGQAKQVEFDGVEPSYRLIDGISRVSHADHVARKIGFSKEDIERYLEEQENK